MRSEIESNLSPNRDRTRPGSTLRLLSTNANRRAVRSENFVYKSLTLAPQIWTRFYDHLGKVVEESLSEFNGTLIFRWVYFYDEQGKKVRANLHDREDKVIASSFYDEHQTPINRVTYNSVYPNAA